jgi:hypothetical protein
MIVLLFKTGHGVYDCAYYKSQSDDLASYAHTYTHAAWNSATRAASGYNRVDSLKSIKAISNMKIIRNKSLVFAFKDFNRWFIWLLTT